MFTTKVTSSANAPAHLLRQSIWISLVLTPDTTDLPSQQSIYVFYCNGHSHGAGNASGSHLITHRYWPRWASRAYIRGWCWWSSGKGNSIRGNMRKIQLEDITQKPCSCNHGSWLELLDQQKQNDTVSDWIVWRLSQHHLPSSRPGHQSAAGSNNSGLSRVAIFPTASKCSGRLSACTRFLVVPRSAYLMFTHPGRLLL